MPANISRPSRVGPSEAIDFVGQGWKRRAELELRVVVLGVEIAPSRNFKAKESGMKVINSGSG